MKSSTIVVLAVILAAGYFVRSRFPGFILSRTSSGADCVAMTGSTTTEDEGRTYIVGSVKNNCDRNFGQVTISFKVDRSPDAAEVLSPAPVYAYTRDIKAGETREFKTLFPISRDASYRFDGINAF